MKNFAFYVAIGALLLNGLVAATYFSWKSIGNKDSPVVSAEITPQPSIPPSPPGEVDKPRELKPGEKVEKRIEIEERFSRKEPDRPPNGMINGERDADKDLTQEKPKTPPRKKQPAVKRPPKKPKEQLCKVVCEPKNGRRGSGHNSGVVELF